MKTLRVVIALFMALTMLKSCGQLMEAEPASGWMYPLITLGFLLLPFWIIRRALKKK